jgi:acyl-homoserine lactone acylase PvdQ
VTGMTGVPNWGWTVFLAAGLSACAPGDGRIRLADVEAPVQLAVGDSVARISARTDTDGFYALGVAHAQLRPNDLRVQHCRIHVCDVGSDVLTLGLVGLGEQRLLQSTPQERRLLDAYARGVRDTLPSLPWQAADSVALVYLRGLGHSAGLMTERAALLSQQLDVLDLDDAIRDDGLATETAWNDLRGGLPRDPAIPSAFLTPAPVASAVAVAGRRSESGASLLGALIGRRIGEPAMIAVQLDTPGFHVSGLTEPGIPAFWAGRNLTTAWSLTAANADAMDLVVVGLQERIYTVGLEEFVLADDDTTHLGPLVARTDELGLVLRMAGVEPIDETLPVLWALAQTPTVIEAVRAFDRPVGSAWHLVSADTQGHIADAVVGRIVRRRGVTGRVPHDVRDGDLWQGRVDRLPRTLDPPMGLVATTGARPRSPVSVAMGADFPDGRRADRLAAQVAWQSAANSATLWTSLSDPFLAETGLPSVLNGVEPGTESGQKCHDALLAWDGDVRDSGASATWAAWRRALSEQTLETWQEPAAQAWRALGDHDPEPPGAPWGARPVNQRAAALDTACAAPLGVQSGAAGALWPAAPDAVAGGIVIDLADPTIQVWDGERLRSLADLPSRAVTLQPR